MSLRCIFSIIAISGIFKKSAGIAPPPPPVLPESEKAQENVEPEQKSEKAPEKIEKKLLKKVPY